MDRAGERLKRVRDRLRLTYRDVEQASQKIAARHQSDEFAIALSRLADIENKGTVPTVYRMYSLCAIYRLEFDEVLRWYGVPRDQLASETLHLGLQRTHALGFVPRGPRSDSAVPYRGYRFGRDHPAQPPGAKLGKSRLQLSEWIGFTKISVWIYWPGRLVDVPDFTARLPGSN